MNGKNFPRKSHKMVSHPYPIFSNDSIKELILIRKSEDALYNLEEGMIFLKPESLATVLSSLNEHLDEYIFKLPQ